MFLFQNVAQFFIQWHRKQSLREAENGYQHWLKSEQYSIQQSPGCPYFYGLHLISATLWEARQNQEMMMSCVKLFSICIFSIFINNQIFPHLPEGLKLFQGNALLTISTINISQLNSTNIKKQQCHHTVSSSVCSKIFPLAKTILAPNIKHKNNIWQSRTEWREA